MSHDVYHVFQHMGSADAAAGQCTKTLQAGDPLESGTSGAGGAYGGGDHGRKSGVIDPGGIATDVGGEASLALHHLVGDRTTGDSGHDETPAGARSRHSTDQESAGGYHGGADLEVPLGQATGREARGRPHGDAIGDVEVQSGRPATSSGPSGSGAECMLEGHRRASTQGAYATLTPSTEDGRDDLRESVRWRTFLHSKIWNTCNYCYQNATFLMLWGAHVLADLQLNRPWQAVVRAIGEASVRCLPDHPTWSLALSHWQDPDTQHDAAEFLMHMLSVYRHETLSGSWRAMTEGVLTDTVSTEYGPIILHFGKARSIPSMIQAWHQEGTVTRGLQHCPRMVILQFARYMRQGAQTRKIRIPLSIPANISLPCWRGGEIVWMQYTPRSGLLHLGETVTTGHYQSFARHSEGGVHKTYITDDGAWPVEADQKTHDIIKGNLYLLVCSMDEVT